MQYLGIEYQVKHHSELDPQFIPFGVWTRAYLKTAAQPIAIAIERENGQITVRRTMIHGTADMAQADCRYLERYVKFLLWSIGGFRVYICGCSALAAQLKQAYSPEGERSFDCTFVQQLYERDLEIIDLPLTQCPSEQEQTRSIGGHLDGCRIGFDAGGSDRKVSAVVDGQVIYSEEVVWFPKLQEDPDYHFRHIVEAFRTAAEKMPRVDAIGVSSAGVFIGNAPMVASLFMKVPRSRWDQVKTIYDRAAAEIGNVPVVVANDGDVSALAGAMELGIGKIMGIAMGTSQAVGYVDTDGNVPGWINELAFAPVDLSESALQDEWSTDYGVGCKYFSQDAVIKLSPAAGIALDESLSPAEKLKVVQDLMEQDDHRAAAIFETIGMYLAYTLVLYQMFYEIGHVMLLGRVMSGKGGDTILRVCRSILSDEFPELAKQYTILLPDETTRRVGQSAAAASLPALRR